MAAVFTDSGVFVALGSERDDHHQHAVEAYDRLISQKATLLTTNHVVDETCNWLIHKLADGHKRALQFGGHIRDGMCIVGTTELPAGRHLPHRLVIVYATPEIERRAWDILAKYDTAGFTFTDCVSFAVMQSLGVKKAFAYDTHFDVMGFERLP